MTSTRKNSLKILTLEFQVNLPEIINKTYNDKLSLLDADIIVANPARIGALISQKATGTRPDGKKVMNLGPLNSFKEANEKIKNEISILLSNGKIIFIFLSPKQTYLGQIDSRNVQEINNYQWLPNFNGFNPNNLITGKGKEIHLKESGHPASSYFHAYKENLFYEAYYSSKTEESCFLQSKSGHPVGFHLKESKGHIIFIPEFTWEEQPTSFKKFKGTIEQCSKPLLNQITISPPPEWLANFPIPQEDAIRNQINEKQEQIEETQKIIKELEQKESYYFNFRRLLFEQGEPLEESVRQAFKLMSFSAEPFVKDDMEHDVILTSNEGRIIVEIEGKNNSAIDIKKLDQLSRVVDEDFQRNKNPEPEYALGLLVGNPHRKTSPNERTEPFTKKLLISAKRKRFKIITTQELFKAVCQILTNPNDDKLKENYRDKIFSSTESQIKF
jgi:hypothetical protein